VKGNYLLLPFTNSIEETLYLFFSKIISSYINPMAGFSYESTMRNIKIEK